MLADILMVASGLAAGCIAALTLVTPRIKSPKTRAEAQQILAYVEEAKKILDTVEGDVTTTKPSV